MADPFATGLGTLFRGPRAVAALFIPAAGGPSLPIRIVRYHGSGDVGSGFARTVVDTNAVVIQRADVARPLAGDVVTIGPDTANPETLRLQGEPALDDEGVSWTCPAVPA